MTTSTVAKRTFQAVMISCCAVEYATAVSVGTSQHVSSASAFVACVMPAAPGVTDATFASDPDPTTHITDSNVTGIANPARKIAMTPSLHSQERKDGRNARVRY